MSEHFNNLTPAQAERLAILSEELGEAQKAIGKILRHGYHSWNPDIVSSATNKEDLEKELGDVVYAINMITGASDIDGANVGRRVIAKMDKIKPYLHHQEP